MSFDRFEAYKQLIGGEQNLPPRLPTPPPSSHPVTSGSVQSPTDLEGDEKTNPGKIVDAFGNLQTYDNFVTTHPLPAPDAPAYDSRHAIKHQQNNTASRRTQGVLSESGDDIDFTLDPRKGEPSELGMTFCPFLAITKFPYRYVNPELRQPIATAFFDEGKIYDRTWDYYYAWSDQAGKAIAFVPLRQAQALVDVINQTFADLHWRFQPRDEEQGLSLTFDDPNPDYRPRFLGTANSREKYDFLLNSIEPQDIFTMDSVKDFSLAAFKEKMALAAEANKNKQKKMKKEKLGKNILNRQSMTKQLLQAQRYLGLLPGETHQSRSHEHGINSVNTNEPLPHIRESDVIIIAIDVESYERAHGIITEVGVSTLDTRDLQGTAPGKNGQNWHQFIRARHFRVSEHMQYENKDFVSGCAENFDFGTSELVNLKNMPSVLTQCFHEPFSKPAHGSGAIAPVTEEPGAKRNIILLGHDIGNDIQYCHQLGFSVLNRGNMLATMDTKAMYQAYTRDTSPRGLGGIMNDFDFLAWHQHNAGNDAVFTIWAMLATCVQDAVERGTAEAQKKHEECTKNKLETAIQTAKERAVEDAQGWEVGGQHGAPLPHPPSASGHYTLGGAPLDL